jgi:hypothetical protein
MVRAAVSTAARLVDGCSILECNEQETRRHARYAAVDDRAGQEHEIADDR